MANDPDLTINGWRIFAHPLFLDRIETLAGKVESLRRRNPENYRSKNATKQLAVINDLIWKQIPENPADKKYRQGKTLGDDHKHWCRAKFFQQYRLFFRYHSAQKVIIYAWVNDDKTKRAYKSSTDAYYTFAKMLDSGNPPTSWDELIEARESQDFRLRNIIPRDS